MSILILSVASFLPAEGCIEMIVLLSLLMGCLEATGWIEYSNRRKSKLSWNIEIVHSSIKGFLHSLQPA